MKLDLKVKLDELQIDMQNLAEETARDMVSMMASLAEQTYEKAKEMASQKLHTTAQQYINALDHGQEDENTWVVTLHKDAEHLEDGYPGFHMLPKLAQGPASKMGKDGHRYTVIPFKHTTAPANPGNSKQADLASRLKSEIKMRQFKQVRAGTSSKTGKYTTVERMVSGASTHPYLKGLVRVREYKSQEHAHQKGSGPISSSYYTFRIASEKQNPAEKWVHPGFVGVKIFPDVFQWAELELEQLIVDFAF